MPAAGYPATDWKVSGAVGVGSNAGPHLASAETAMRPDTGSNDIFRLRPRLATIGTRGLPEAGMREEIELSEREREVLGLLMQGHETKSIAAALGLSIQAVNERLRDARRKLGASSSREAARRYFGDEPGRFGRTNSAGQENRAWRRCPGGIRRSPARVRHRREPQYPSRPGSRAHAFHCRQSPWRLPPRASSLFRPIRASSPPRPPPAASSRRGHSLCR